MSQPKNSNTSRNFNVEHYKFHYSGYTLITDKSLNINTQL